MNPSAKILEGYQPIMPTYKGQVTEEQLVSLVAYIKSLSGNTSGGGMTTGGSGSTSTAVPTSQSGTGRNNVMTNTQTNTVNPTAERGQSNRQGSNPNAPGNRSAPDTPR